MKHGERQSAAAAVTGEHDRGCRHTLAHDLAIDVDPVAHGGGETEFRREAIIESEDRRFGALRKTRDQRAMALRRTRDVTAAMEIEDQAVGRTVRAADPFAFQWTDLGR